MNSSSSRQSKTEVCLGLGDLWVWFHSVPRDMGRLPCIWGMAWRCRLNLGELIPATLQEQVVCWPSEAHGISEAWKHIQERCQPLSMAKSRGWQAMAYGPDLALSLFFMTPSSEWFLDFLKSCKQEEDCATETECGPQSLCIYYLALCRKSLPSPGSDCFAVLENMDSLWVLRLQNSVILRCNSLGPGLTWIAYQMHNSSRNFGFV